MSPKQKKKNGILIRNGLGYNLILATRSFMRTFLYKSNREGA